MDYVIGGSIVVVTLGLVALFYAIFKTLKIMGVAIEDAKRTMVEIRTELQQVSQETREVVRNTNEITLDAQKKLKELDALFGTVKEVGGAVQSLTSSFRQIAVGTAQRIKRKEQAVQETKAGGQPADNGVAEAIADGIASSIRIWNRLKQN